MQQPTAKARSTTRNRIDDWTDSCGSVTIPAIAVQSIADLSEEPGGDHLKAANVGAEAHAPLPYLRGKREECAAAGHVKNLYSKWNNTSTCACGLMQHAGIPDSIVPPATHIVYIVTIGQKGAIARMLASHKAYKYFDDAKDRAETLIRNDVWNEFIPEREGVVREWRTPGGRAVWIEQLVTVDRYESGQCSS